MLAVYSKCWIDTIMSKRQLGIVSSCPIPQTSQVGVSGEVKAVLHSQASAEPQNTLKATISQQLVVQIERKRESAVSHLLK